MKKNSRTKSVVALAIVLVLTLFFGIVGVVGLPLDSEGLYTFGPWLPTTDAANWPDLLELGLDLRGGVYVEYTAALPASQEGQDVDFDSLLDGTISVIQNRLTDAGYAESTVQKIGTNGIRVEIPTSGSADDEVSARNTVLDLIGETAHMEFRGPDGEVLFDGTHVKSATVFYNSNTTSSSERYGISFELDSVGAEIFATATSQNIGKNITIYLDDTCLVNATVQSAITEGKGQITGNYDYESARKVAAQIQSGALPLDLTQDKVDTVSATLGPNALSTSVLAALIGIALVMVIMISRYRLNGVVASWALTIYIIVLFMLIALIPGIQLTLPGLAGIVLGIGMAVDANVIIFERFNEEIRAGRSVKQSVRAGFKNAMSAILDANVTTVIAAIVLLIFGTASVQGFGKTLLLGVITSFFTAVFVTRFLMNRFVGAGLTKTSLYCGKKNEKEVA